MAEESGTSIGKAYVQIVPSTKGIKGHLEKLFSENMPNGKSAGNSFGKSVVSGFGNTIKKGFSTVVKTGLASLTAASAGIGAIVKQSVSAYGEYEQNVGGIETLFKDNADTVVKYASQAYKTAGMSANEYMQNVTGFSATLLQGLGGDTQKAADVANQAMIDMSDNANKFGTDISSIQNAYQGFAKQNYTMLDNLKLGYGGTQAEMARLINDSGVLGDSMTVTANTVNQVSFDKIIEAIHTVQQNLDVTGTTSKEASTTIQGSLSSVKASFQNLLTSFGDKNGNVKQNLNELIGSVNDFAKNLMPVIKQALVGIGEAVTQLAPQIAEIIPDLVSQVLPGLMTAGASVISALVQGISQNAPMLAQSFAQSLTTIIQTISSVLPQVITAIIGVVQAIIPQLPTILQSLLTALSECLPDIVNTIIEMIPMLIDTITENLPLLIEMGLQMILSITEGIVDNIEGVVDGIIQMVDSIVDALTTGDTIEKLTFSAIKMVATLAVSLVAHIPDILVSAGKLALGLVKGIASGIVDAFSYIDDAVSDMFLRIADWFKQKWEDFKTWGSDMIHGFIDGIKSAASDLWDSVKDVAGGIADFLGFSEPEKGPLSNFHTYAPDMMQLFAQGIKDNEDVIQMQFNRSLQPIVDTDVLPADITMMPQANVESNNSDVFQSILNLLNDYFPQIANKDNNIYIDGEQLTSKIDSKLGKRTQNVGRRLASV